VGPDQKPVCGNPLFDKCEEDGMAMITDAGSPSLIWSFLPASFLLVRLGSLRPDLQPERPA